MAAPEPVPRADALGALAPEGQGAGASELASEPTTSQLRKTLEKEIMKIATKKYKMSEEIVKCLYINDSACFS